MQPKEQLPQASMRRLHPALRPSDLAIPSRPQHPRHTRPRQSLLLLRRPSPDWPPSLSRTSHDQPYLISSLPLLLPLPFLSPPLPLLLPLPLFLLFLRSTLLPRLLLERLILTHIRLARFRSIQKPGQLRPAWPACCSSSQYLVAPGAITTHTGVVVHYFNGPDHEELPAAASSTFSRLHHFAWRCSSSSSPGNAHGRSKDRQKVDKAHFPFEWAKGPPGAITAPAV